MPPTTRASKRRAIEGPLATPEPSHIATTPEDGAYAESSTGCPDTPESEVESDPKPTLKRARCIQGKTGSVATKTSKRMKVKGKLEVFKNVPVEVFIQIAKYLHPFDLVLLSRVNKFFRELFMSRQAASIWISARHNVPDLPPCPPELCEPQYAALIFTKICSQCGKYTPRHMDSMLLVRLCTSCREEQFKLIPTMIPKITDMSLIARSIESVPGNLRHYGRLFLSSDVEAVESKLKELTAAGNKDDLSRWRRNRQNAIQDRGTNAGLFQAWFAARDRERENDLNQRKDAYETEIEARLISLGWEQEDHEPPYNPRRKQWLSLVRAAKVLTDRAWDKLLPQLLVHLEANKQERLERERIHRKSDRQNQLHQFWHATKNQLPPLLQATPQMDNTEAALLSAAVGEKNKLDQPFPSHTGFRDWPEYLQLLDEDITGDELKTKLLAKQDSFDAFARKWRDQLEENLIKHLPDHIELPNFNAAGFSLTSNSQPADSLFAGTQMLLRADVIFKQAEYYSCCFYPEDFLELYDPAVSQTKYNSDSSAIATDLLRVLGRSGATYLEMKSLGDVFQCGKCGHCGLMSWRGLVRHYVDVQSEWETLSKQLAAVPSNEFIYIFTHDTSIAAEDPNKPLVWIAEGDGAPASPFTPRKLCLVCQAVGFYISFPGTYVNDHLRDAHSIEEPELGKHFMVKF